MIAKAIIERENENYEGGVRTIVSGRLFCVEDDMDLGFGVRQVSTME